MRIDESKVGARGGKIRAGGRPGRSDPRGNNVTRANRRLLLASKQGGYGGSGTYIRGKPGTPTIRKPGDVPCVFCGARLTPKPEEPGAGGQKLEIDRKVEGGPYRPPNIQPACPTCNKARNSPKFKAPLEQGALPGVGHTGAPLSPMQFQEHGINWP